MEDKYNMTKEQNIFLAKRCIVDSIWKSSHIEGIDITYPETQKLYDGGKWNAIGGADTGSMRVYDVNIGGTNWKPKIPNENEVIENLQELNKIECITDRAITIMCYLMRTQFFSDGNKRTAMLFANKIMIQNGKGIISIPVDEDIHFGEELTKFYETNNMESLKQFIYDKCISGIVFPNE